MIDCELLSKVYINLLDQKEPIFQFKEKKLSDITSPTTTSDYSKKIIEITKEELKEHEIFLKKELKKNYF